MNDRQTVVAAYNATPEAADGLALARLMASATDADLLVTRVFADTVRSAELDPASQRANRVRIGATRAAMLAAVPETADATLVPVLDPDVPKALHDVALVNKASFLVAGSSHHSSLGRVLLGGTAEQVINGSPCPVAVAPPSFCEAPGINPRLVVTAYDGTVASVDALLTAVDLARAFGTPLRVVSVTRSAQADQLFEDAEAVVRDASVGLVTLECVRLEGSPSSELINETSNAGLLVMGSRGFGPIRRALLGSVSTAVIRHASCPVVVVPRRG
jgi:nucleotide-binding universal stress UspA family protein